MKRVYATVVMMPIVVSSLAVGTVALAAPIKMLETGSTLLYPLMNIWVKDYQGTNTQVRITTQGTGSGTGISQAISGVAQIGASDAYLSGQEMKQAAMLNIPLAISAQQVNYNIPEIGASHLNLTGPVLAGIYDGGIKFWDDAAIKSINGSLASKLPHRTIVPVRRSDGSGDTFIFTQYLTDTTPSWKNGPGFGTTISWPAVPNEVGANGNPGMVQTCKATMYSVAYIGVSFLDQTNHAKLGYAALRNRAGNYVLPTHESIAAAARSLATKTPVDERISLIDAPGKNAYPIVNYEYAIVNAKQPDPAVAASLKKFLTWAISPTEGNKGTYLDQVHFVPLPAAVMQKSLEQIAKVQ